MRTSKRLLSVAVAIVMGLGISLPTSVHGYAGGHGPTMNEKLLTFFMQGSTNVGY